MQWHKLANGTTLDRFDYFYTDGSGTYDPTGRLQREVDAGGRTHAFTYTKHGELTAESHPDFGNRAFAYDANGNRTSWTQPGLGTVYTGYDGQNKLKWVNTNNSQPFQGQANPYRLYTYDLKGRPTQLNRRDTSGGAVATDKFEWDPLDHLTRVADLPTNTERYKAWYDADGERVKSRYGGVDHVYSYGAGLLHDSAGGGTVYTPGVGHRQAGVDHYYHSDWLGTTRYTTGATGLASLSAQRFDAWGNVSASAGGGHGGSLRWAGGVGYEADGPDGLSMLGARYYDPVVGRFVSPDPISFAGGMNLYAYCGGDPVNAVDPDGTSPGLIVGIGVAGVDGALSASDRYVRAHEEDGYTWYGHLGANAKGALYGVVGIFDPRNSARAFGEAVGREESGRGSKFEVSRAGADTAATVIAVVMTARGCGGGSYLGFRGWRGRLGNIQTRLQIRRISAELKRRGWTVEHGGAQIPHRPEEYIAPAPGRATGTYVDATFVKGNRRLRLQTVDTDASGNPTPSEVAAIKRIRHYQKSRREHLLVIPKRR